MLANVNIQVFSELFKYNRKNTKKNTSTPCQFFTSFPTPTILISKYLRVLQESPAAYLHLLSAPKPLQLCPHSNSLSTSLSKILVSCAQTQAAWTRWIFGIQSGKIAALASNLDPATARETFDGKNQLAFPGLVDAHMHTGIYSPLGEDALTESRAAAMGGVTSNLNYMRTGQYYLNKSAPYKEFFSEVLEISNGRFYLWTLACVRP